MHPTLEKAQKLLTLAADERGNEHERRNAAMALVKLIVEQHLSIRLSGEVAETIPSQSSAPRPESPVPRPAPRKSVQQVVVEEMRRVADWQKTHKKGKWTPPPAKPPRVPKPEECGWASVDEETWGVWCHFELEPKQIISVKNQKGDVSLVRIVGFHHRGSRRNFPAWFYEVEWLGHAK